MPKHEPDAHPDWYWEERLPPPEPYRPSWQVSMADIGERLADPGPDPCTLVVHGEEVAAVYELALWRALRALPPRERLVLSWRYGLGREEVGQQAVASRLGCTVRWVHELERRGLALLRGELHRAFIDEAA